jgi:hypothetical protein
MPFGHPPNATSANITAASAVTSILQLVWRMRAANGSPAKHILALRALLRKVTAVIRWLMTRLLAPKWGKAGGKIQRSFVGSPSHGEGLRSLRMTGVANYDLGFDASSWNSAGEYFLYGGAELVVGHHAGVVEGYVAGAIDQN